MAQSAKNSSKDTIYVDVDDEITAIIEKVSESPAKVVALVLPKRATVFQSIVNMKLLKRTAAESKKHVVLITSEGGLLPMAGAVGLHVAKTLQSKPLIPAAPIISDRPVSVDDDRDETDAGAGEPELDPTRPIGEYTAADGAEETIEVGDAPDVPTDESKGKVTDTTKKKDKRLKIPNFNKFRALLFGGIVLIIALIAGGVFAFVVLPKAKITIRTNDVNVNVKFDFKTAPTIKTTDVAALAVPAETKQFKKTDTQKVAATGQKDVGTKATGKATLTLMDCQEEQVVVPAGTILSSSGSNFVTQAEVLLKSVKIGSQCRNQDFPDFSTTSVSVQAQEAGDKYNLSARAYTLSGFANVSAAGSAMTGGTSKMVTIVSQSDVDGAKQKMLDAGNTAGRQTVEGQLKAGGYIPIPETFGASEPLVTASPNVGDEAAEVTVTVAVTYSQTGAQKEGVTKLVEADITKQIDPEAQKILDNGVDKAVLKLAGKTPAGELTVTLQTTAVAGVQQNVDDIKKSVTNKKKGEVQEIIKQRPGVEDVTVEFSPFWVYKTPRSENRITIVFQQSDGSTTSGQ